MEFFLFFLFLLPFVLIRLRFHKKTGLALGISTDIASAAQLSVVSSFSPVLFLVLLGIFVPYTLFDAMLQREIGIRMRLSLFHHVKQAKSFWDSAKELGIYRFMAFTTAWWVVSIFLAVMTPAASPSFPFLGVVAVALLNAVIFLLKSKPMERYQVLHPFILEEFETTRALFQKKKCNKEEWKPLQEQYFLPSDDFPLFRLTKEFTGEKQISINLAADEKPHIVVLVLESFRSKSVKVCDPTAPEELTPRFNQMAKEGVLWRQFYCASARSCKALIATLFGVSSKEDSEIFKHNPSYPLRGLPEIFKEYKYFNALLQGGDLEFDSIREFGEVHRFDIVEGAQEIAARYQHDIQGNFWGLHDEFLMKRAIELLKENDQMQKPTFLNVYTISNHHPWRLPTGESEKSFYKTESAYEQRFQQTIHYTDRCLGAFVDELKKSGLLKKTILFVTGDHGQGFCEHGDKLLDREGLYEEYIWVPLLMLAEGRDVEPQVIEEVASQQDLLPTLLDLFKLPTFHHAMGRSLLRSSKDAAASFHSPFFPPRFGLRKAQWKWIVNPETQEEELYDLAKDPEEKVNLAAELPQIAEDLRKEAAARKGFLEYVFEKRRLFPTQDSTEEEKVIDLRGRRDLCDEELEEIVSKSPPTTLKLDDCTSITDRALINIAPYCGMLKTLSVRNCTRIGISGLEAICHQTRRLRNFDISHCLQLDEQELERVFVHGNSLHALFLEGLFISPGNLLTKIAQNFPHLRSFSLLETPLGDVDIEAITRHCKELKFLRLDARQLSDRALEYIGKGCRHLVGIHLSACTEFTDAGLSQLMRCSNLYSAILIDCPKASGKFLKNWKRLFLSNLYLCNVPNFEDEAIADMLDHPLKQLQIQECPRLSDQGIRLLAELGAKSIHVVGCPNISQEAIEYLKEKTETVYWG